MANHEHLDWVLQGEPWKALKSAYLDKDVHLDLSGADLAKKSLCGLPLCRANLSGAKLGGCDLTDAWLTGANLTGSNLEAAYLTRANLAGTNLTNANLTNAHLTNADLTNAVLVKTNLAETKLHNAVLVRANLSDAYCPGAKFVKANLSEAIFRQAYLFAADFTEATLVDADLSFATLVGSVLDGANITGACIYGISAWDVKLNEKTQQNHLRISRTSEPVITVDDLEVAQFIYILLNNKKVRQVINTITSKVVLILGRFTPERKAILNSIRDELRRHDYVPVLFDFEKPSSRTTVETISTLAHMAKFVIADITDAKCVLLELQEIVPGNPSVPVQPLLLSSQEEPGMFNGLRRYPWMLDTYRYNDLDELLRSLGEKIILPAELKAKELATGK